MRMGIHIGDMILGGMILEYVLALFLGGEHANTLQRKE
jgi:hypothetical protein